MAEFIAVNVFFKFLQDAHDGLSDAFELFFEAGRYADEDGFHSAKFVW